MKNIIWLIPILFFVACLKDDENSNGAAVRNTTESMFLKEGEVPKLKLTIVNNEEMVLTLESLENKVRELSLPNDSGGDSKINEHFLTDYCGLNVLVVVLRQPVNTGISHGYYYVNAVVNIKDGSLIKIIEEGEVSDKETGEIISDGQKNAIAQLKSGKQPSTMCSQSQQ